VKPQGTLSAEKLSEGTGKIFSLHPAEGKNTAKIGISPPLPPLPQLSPTLSIFCFVFIK
jgi:hypothetical protein